MKNYFIFIVVLFFAFFAFFANAESWYIVDKENNVVAKQNGPADEENLEKDGYISVMSNTELNLKEAEYRGGKIVEKVKTSKETKDEKDALDRGAEMDMVRNRSLKDSYDALVAEGVVFKFVTEKSFEEGGK